MKFLLQTLECYKFEVVEAAFEFRAMKKYIGAKATDCTTSNIIVLEINSLR